MEKMVLECPFLSGSNERNRELSHLGEGQQKVTYSNYLQLDSLLSNQTPLSDKHDEMLFIVIHQTMELWFKLLLHELAEAIKHIESNKLNVALKVFSRIHKIQLHLLHSWEVLTTLTPLDFLSFRDHLGTASGAQSFQYRYLEFMLGGRNEDACREYESDRESHARLLKILNTPSMYDVCLKLLADRGFAIPGQVINRDFSLPHEYSEEVENIWMLVYVKNEEYWDLYHLAERLFELDNQFQNWRFTHLRFVERMLGKKMGSGGSHGVAFLSKSIDKCFFPELWTLRSKL